MNENNFSLVDIFRKTGINISGKLKLHYGRQN